VRIFSIVGGRGAGGDGKMVGNINVYRGRESFDERRIMVAASDVGAVINGTTALQQRAPPRALPCARIAAAAPAAMRSSSDVY